MKQSMRVVPSTWNPNVAQIEICQKQVGVSIHNACWGTTKMNGSLGSGDSKKGHLCLCGDGCSEIHSSHMASAAPQSAGLTGKKKQTKNDKFFICSSWNSDDASCSSGTHPTPITQQRPKQFWNLSRRDVNVKWVIPTHLCIRLERVISWWTNHTSKYHFHAKGTAQVKQGQTQLPTKRVSACFGCGINLADRKSVV